MSLLERVAQTRQRIHDLQALKGRAERASEFEQRASTLGGLVTTLTPLCSPVAVLQQAGIEVPELDSALLAVLRSKAADMQANFGQDRSTILAPFPGQDFKHVFVNPCATFRQRTETALKNAWLKWVRSKMPPIDHDVLGVLFEVAALKTAVTRIQDLLAMLHRHAAVLPPSANDVQQVTILCAQAEQAWRELAGDGIAPDVLAFLRAAGGGHGAAFEILTPSVLAWLDAHNLRRVLRIRLG